MTFVHHLAKCDSLGILPVCQPTLVQPIQCVLMLVYRHCQVLRYVRTTAFQIRHRAVVCSFFQVIVQRAISQGSLCHSLHIACFCSSSSLSSSPVMVHSSCDVLNSSTAPMVSLSFAPVSMCTTNSDNCLLQFSVQHLRRRPDSTDVPSSCGGEWDPWSVEHQSCKCAMLL